MGPFDRFNDRAKRAFALAQDEAVRNGNSYIGTEHLLLGLVREGEGVAAQALNRLGLDLRKARAAVEKTTTRGDASTPPKEIVLDPRTKKAIELAIDEARGLGHTYVGTEHLLLALVHEQADVAARVLESLEVTAARVRREVTAVLGELPAEGEAAIPRPNASAFGEFDERSKEVLVLAQAEANRMGHESIGTEHLVIALAQSEDATIKRVFAELGITPERLRAEVAKAAPPKARAIATSDLKVTPQVRRAIENAGVEAHVRRANRVLPEHLLSAMVAAGEGIGMQALAQLGASKERIRELLDRPPPA